MRPALGLDRRFADAQHQAGRLIPHFRTALSGALAKSRDLQVRIAIQLKTRGNQDAINLNADDPAEFDFQFGDAVRVKTARQHLATASHDGACQEPDQP